jgi:hypothetical protein
MGGRLRERALIATIVTLTACAPRPLLDRAVHARGGSIGTVVVDAEATVRRAYPGAWRWRRVIAAPDHYAWTIQTTGEPLHTLFDGAVVRSFVGGEFTRADASDAVALRSQARFLAVAELDVLRLPGVQVAEIARDAVPAGVTAGLMATFAQSNERYAVFFDERGLVVRVEGPADLSPIGRGTLVARRDDFRRVGRWSLPHHVVWELDGAELADERARGVCATENALAASAFEQPDRLPICPVDGSPVVP